MDKTDFLPMTKEEMDALGWPQLDVLIVSGDAYVDHHSFAAAVIGRVLLSHGYKTGIIAQPNWNNPEAFMAMGRPRLFCGVTAGNLDSMLAHYTAARKKRHDDSYTPGGRAGMRPNYPTVVYTQMLKRVFPGITVAIGGIEASMRRCAHYDFWEDKIKPSILWKSKADVLMYGMGERSIIEIAEKCADGSYDFSEIRGTARLAGMKETELLDKTGYVQLPSYESCLKVRKAIFDLTKAVEREMNPGCGKPLMQMHGDRALIIQPPQMPLSEKEMDEVYGLPFTKMPHPSYTEEIPAWNMVKDSITILRGCAGGCSFCSLSFHQGKFLTSRSEESVIKEIDSMKDKQFFKGVISDLGGPTANLYGCRNGITAQCRGCRRPSCLYPQICKNIKLDASKAINLYRTVRKRNGIRHVFVNSGIRMDVAIKFPAYIRELVRHHVSGHLKVAPEHLHPNVLARMRKPEAETFSKFVRMFEKECKDADKEQYIVPYFMSGFPGCTENEMRMVSEFLAKRKWSLQQVQSFIPLPMTAAAAMYYANIDYVTEKSMHVIKSKKLRQESKDLLIEACKEDTEKYREEKQATRFLYIKKRKEDRPKSMIGSAPGPRFKIDSKPARKRLSPESPDINTNKQKTGNESFKTQNKKNDFSRIRKDGAKSGRFNEKSSKSPLNRKGSSVGKNRGKRA